MTAETVALADDISSASVRQLANIEAGRSLRRVSIWVGLALTVLIICGTTADWPGGSYEEKLLAFQPLVLGTFISAFRTGRRDGNYDVSESAPLGPDNRAFARLGSLALPLLLTVLVTVGLAIVSRIEGGFWIGEHPRRTDTALHSISELVQPVLVVAFAGALGIAVGRARPRLSAALGIIVGIFLFTMIAGAWMWNIPPMHIVTPVQVQPLRIDLEPATRISDVPADWYVELTDEGRYAPTRQLVHQPTILGHDLYLVGITIAAAGFAIRHTRGRRVALTGATLAVAGIAVQLIVSPL